MDAVANTILSNQFVPIRRPRRSERWSNPLKFSRVFNPAPSVQQLQKVEGYLTPFPARKPRTALTQYVFFEYSNYRQNFS